MRRISDESVKSKTGKGWAEWFAILDAWSARDKGHTATSKHLREGTESIPGGRRR